MNASNPCFLLEKNVQMGDLVTKHNLKQTFALGVDAAVAFLPKMMQTFVRTDTYINENPIWQSPRALILRKDLRKDFKRYLNYVVTLLTEFDFLGKAFRDFPFNKFLGKTFANLNAVGNDRSERFSFEQAIN